METISSLLSKQLGSKGGSAKKEGPDVSGLPKALQDLVTAVNKSTTSKEKGDKDSVSSADRRQDRINMLQRTFNENVQELNDALAALNETQGNALAQAEKRAKRDDARHAREEAARKRAEKLDEVANRQAKTKANLGADLIGALFGQTLGTFTKNALAAQEQTKEDVASLTSARYEAQVGDAADTEAEKRERAEIRKEDAVLNAAQAHVSAADANLRTMGNAISDMQKALPVLDAAIAAEKNKKAAERERSAVAAEGDAKLKAGVAAAEARVGTVPANSGAVSATPLAPAAPPIIAPDVRGGTLAPPAPPVPPVVPVPPVAPAPPAAPAAPLIITPDGQDALAAVKLEELKNEVASRNLEMDAKVSAANDAFMKASSAVHGVDGDRSAIAQYVGGDIGARGASDAIVESAQAQVAAIKAAEEAEINTKGSAVDEARAVKNAAFDEKMAGTLVSKEEEKAIGKTNMLTGAVAPPALVIIGKVMEKFRDMFPVIEQSGEALIEMGTAIPAVILTSMGQVSAKLLYGLASLRDAIWTPNVRKRYDKSDAAYVEKYGGSRADFYRVAQEARVEEEKKRATTIVSKSSEGALLANSAKAGPVVANAPREYTRTETPDVRGTTGNASTAADARRQERAEEIRERRPINSYTPPLGVVPVSASNRSIDEWR